MKKTVLWGVVYLFSSTAQALEVQYPLDNYAPGSFGGRVFGCCNPRHLGEDHAATPLTPVYAIADGEILPWEASGAHCNFGMVVIIEHTLDDGSKFVSLYGHLSNREGHRPRLSGTVRKGEVIGYVGHSGGLPVRRECNRPGHPDDENGDGGPHLHFAIRLGNPPTYSNGVYRWVYPGYAGRFSQDVDFDAAGNPHGGLFTNPERFLEDLGVDDTDGDGYTVSDGDCDDEDPEINPEAVDRCDGVDNDCSGAADETFVEAGLFTECSVGIGGCRTSGTWICTAEGDGLFCTAPPAGIPRPEICDGQDNDCNDIVDDGDAHTSCDNGIFCDGEEVCVAGRCELGPPIVCNDGVACTIDLCWEPTRACSTVAAHERCDDGVDCTVDRCGPRGCTHQADHSVCDDLDPCTDDWCTASGCRNPFSPDADQDRDGFYSASCSGGNDCNDSNPAVNPGADETCDGVDNDCDEVVDNGVLNACGACGPVPIEVCDGRDNDCDGEIDDGVLNACGECGPVPTEICNGVDDDCDGEVDEGLINACGECGPSPEEVCDGEDNDCDGNIDEEARDCWVATAISGVPSNRAYHTAIWTGIRMIVWGGWNGSTPYLDTGSQYNPITNDWLAISTVNAPYGPANHTAVWAGNRMIVWGGRSYLSYRNTGGQYNPATDTWTDTSIVDAPSSRSLHIAVWTGSEMIIWGGEDGSSYFNDGGRYNPIADNWTTTSTIEFTSPRSNHTAVWTGEEMIVWGGEYEYFDRGTGRYESFYRNTGSRYDPVTDRWTATSTINAPEGRARHTAIWTGSEMIVWGGRYRSSSLRTGGRYDPVADTWVATSTVNVTSWRRGHTAIWTGSEMVVWGGRNSSEVLNTGGRYDPTADSWVTIAIPEAPSARAFHTAIWTGSEMIVWGGCGDTECDSFPNTGGRYTP